MSQVARNTIKFDKKMLDFNSKSISARRDAKRSSAWKNISRPLMRDNSNKFIKGLTQLELSYIEAKCSSVMKTFGYQTCISKEDTLANIDRLNEIETALNDNELQEKPSYLKLPIEERRRFEHWSKMFSDLKRRV